MQTMQLSSSFKLQPRCALARCCSTNRARVFTPRGPCGRMTVVASASPFDAFDRQFAEMDRQFDVMQRQMDRDMDAAFIQARALERQVDAEVQQALRDSARTTRREELRPAANVDVTRQEERGQGYYRYYERIQITGGGRGSYTGAPPPAATSLSAASSPLPALLGAMVLVGGYVALTAAFNRNYQLTDYAESKRWLLAFLWPLLVLFSPKFREQFAAAVKGERPGRKDGKKQQ